MKKIIFLIPTVLVVMLVLYNPSYIVEIVYDKDEIAIPISIHLVDDGTVQYTTNRDIKDIYRLFDEVNSIWGQAQIKFFIEDIDTVDIENSEFNSVLSGDVEVLTKRGNFDEGMINGYFARYISANGVTFPP